VVIHSGGHQITCVRQTLQFSTGISLYFINAARMLAHLLCSDLSGGDVSIAGNRLRTISGKTPHILHRPVESYANSRRVFDQKDIKS